MYDSYRSSSLDVRKNDLNSQGRLYLFAGRICQSQDEGWICCDTPGRPSVLLPDPEAIEEKAEKEQSSHREKEKTEDQSEGAFDGDGQDGQSGTRKNHPEETQREAVTRDVINSRFAPSNSAHKRINSSRTNS